jgi:glycine betaine/proline transport system permease protein
MRRYSFIILPLLIIFLLVIHHFVQSFGIFPAEWNFGLRQPLDEFKSWVVINRQDHWLFAGFFDPLSYALDHFIRQVEAFLLWLPWPVLSLAVFLLAQKLGNLRIALVSVSCLWAMGLLGLWDESMATLGLMLASVGVALGIGLPLGVWAGQNDRVEKVLRPILDGMQTMPAFVYLIPVILFFGVARVPSLVATVIYALPPAIRFTNLGLRRVPPEALEAAEAFGATERQILYKVKIPMALPTIMAGVNQTIMMALGIVVIAAMIGAGGLGQVVLTSLRRLQVGQAMEAGLAIVVMAVLLDRLSYALSQYDPADPPGRKGYGYRLFPQKWQGIFLFDALEAVLDRLYTAGSKLTIWVAHKAKFLPNARRDAYWLISAVAVGVSLVFFLWLDVRAFPEGWQVNVQGPIDTAVVWMQTNLYQIGDSNFGTGPLSDFINLRLLTPLRNLLTDWLPWPVVILLFAWLAYLVEGKKLAMVTAVGLLLIGWLGMWELAMDTLSQVIVAVLLSVIIGVPLGIWAARSDSVERSLRPIMDFLQTIPAFVYLVPVIMLFSIGRVPGIMASVLYALPPTVRLTNLGIRQVDETVVEAAQAFGSSSGQVLRKVQLPLATPAIMLGINQPL